MIEVTVDLSNGTGDHAVAAEVLATAEHIQEFVGKDRNPDVQLAVTHAVDRVTQQIKHYKEKLQDHRRDPSRGTAGL